MSVVIDADSHLQHPLCWLDKHHPELNIFRGARAFSPLMYYLPPEEWPEDESQMYSSAWYQFLLAQRDAIEHGVDLDDMVDDPSVDLGAIARLFRSRGAWDGTERIAVLDEVGTDFQLVSGIGIGKPGATPEETRDYIALANTISCEQLAGHTDRLIPIVTVDFTDVEWTLGELARTRALGSRVFHVPASPVDGKSISHPDFDRVWAAASDLGMLGYLHQFGEPFDLAWANNGGNYLMLTMMSSVRYHHSAEQLAVALIGGGIFARFPKFGVVMAEIGGLAWLPNLLQWIDAFTLDPTMHAMEGIQEWPYELAPSEYAQRQLRVAPLPNQAQKASPWLEQLGDIPVFSSDYPHPEGTPDPVIDGPEAGPEFFRRDLADVDPARRERFFGDSLADLFARTGDPLAR
jgi:predicted TIM-barrel fold metal-dependent hydrolase